MASAINVCGARTNNLKNVDVSIPHNQLTVVSGPSGSGKSSLAIDTIFSEAQRQYIESLSLSSQQWIFRLPLADADVIDGLPASISIDQHKGFANPRSTVGTLSEIYDYLRVLFARAGVPHCPKCARSIQQTTIEQLVQRLEELPERTKVMVLAPCRRASDQSIRALIHSIRKSGQVRIHIDGQVFDIDEFDQYENGPELIDAVVDRVIIKKGIQSRLRESLGIAEKTANELGNKGAFAVSVLEPQSAHDCWQVWRYSSEYRCPDCNIAVGEVEARTFSFNSPFGSCERCNGIGSVVQFDPELFIFDWNQSLNGHAVRPWQSLGMADLQDRIAKLRPTLQQLEVDSNDSLEKLDSRQRKLLLGNVEGDLNSVFGLVNFEWATCTDKKRLAELEMYRHPRPCPGCGGDRLNQVSQHVTFLGKTIVEINRMDLQNCLAFFCDAASTKLQNSDQAKHAVAAPLISEIVSRLTYLNSIGLSYLSLLRSTDSLSGGEFQRVRLATAIGTSLTGVCYILDEPTAGLHPGDSMKLINALQGLRDQENTVIVVEHDELVKLNSDWLIEIGPGAGPKGGQILYSGPTDPVVFNSSAETNLPAGTSAQRLTRKPNWERSVEIRGAIGHNLKSVNVRIPLDVLVCFTGVSGSGKSTLVNETLVPALKRQLGILTAHPEPFESLSTGSLVQHVVAINQTPIGRSPRSNAATFTGIMDEIRKLFASTRKAKQLGYSASRFSFNSKAGACSACQGFGARKLKLTLMPDTWIRCDLCGGARYNEETLQVKFGEKNIAEVLQMSVLAAAEFFKNVEKIRSVLQCLDQIGLGYLKLGQPANTLSGGEAQRVNLALALSKRSQKHTLYVLDEPTVGLHRSDVQMLLSVINELIDSGNTIIVIEHNLDLIANSDWIIDMGPHAGPAGGEVIFEGTPAQLSENEVSETGKYLKAQG
jgi:excinuclease ABC subunit A